MTDLHTFDNVQKFDSYTPERLIRSELGIHSFTEIAPDLIEIKAMINEMIAITETQDSVTTCYATAINKYINDFNIKAEAILLYNIDNDEGNDFGVRNEIIDDVTNWINAIYNGSDINHTPYGFMILYNSLKLNALLSFQKDRSLIEQLKADLELSTQKANELVTRLQASTTALSVYDYSAPFQQQVSKRHPRKEVHKGTTLVQFIITIFIVWFVIYFIWVYFG
jgi:hypothetical protein